MLSQCPLKIDFENDQFSHFRDPQKYQFDTLKNINLNCLSLLFSCGGNVTDMAQLPWYKMAEGSECRSGKSGFEK